MHCALGARTGALVNMTLPAGGVAMVATVILELSSIFNAVLTVCKHGHSDVKLALYWRHKQLFGALVVLLSRSKQPEPERAGRQPRCHRKHAMARFTTSTACVVNNISMDSQPCIYYNIR